ncbi:efflux RND transporter periplasmic adaptor subunit [Methylocystis parvus]|uniref:Efflux RND transporter periplasmic adaptor subunit n=1 Tax=Methylocystis parvus TaxID=134 RepID=A0A6B8MG95_9HYPH|nr:efflux RND transporter periplasmic adaptor subunit [Methylocystis parvus]QGN00184.1 efflux RND transporter periplasmic adaptor subunit [Methylocystis parvus]WBK02506.1 efflux RND transporter periplasmic adaptor subunit [Methylocystis parvus OBBP]
MRAWKIIAFFAAVLAALGAYWVWPRESAKLASSVPPPITVTAASTTTADVPIFLRGLGTVTAFNTVAAQSRVVGNIVRINFNEGQEVRQGNTLVEIDPRPFQAVYDQAKASLARDQATLLSARQDLARYAKLQSGNYVTRQQFTQQQSTVAASEATIQLDNAAVEAAQLNLDYCSVKSPIDGVTGLKQVDIGNLVQANSQTLVVVTQIKPIYIVFTLPEAESLRVRTSMAGGMLTVLAFDQADQREIARGVLKLIDNQIDQTTGTVKLKAQFANADGSLWPGQFVNAHLIVETVKNGVIAPSIAVQSGPNGNYAYVIKQDSVVEMRPITVLQTEHDTALIGSGLRPAEKVVTSGYSQLAPGMRVTVKDEAPASATDKREAGR